MQAPVTDAPSDNSQKVSLAALSEMTGFPAELIQQELFMGQGSEEGVSLDELRALMLNFIDATLLEDKK